MTKTSSAAAMATDDFDIDSLIDHFNHRRREIAIGAVVVAVIAGGFLLWRMSVAQKSERGNSALTQATDALYAGNRPLAQTELQAAVDRYRDTPAGVEAAMVLAQLDFEDGRWADGIKVLEGVQSSSVIANFKAPIDGLIGGADADLKKYDDAVKHYQAAEAATEFQSGKDIYLADQARVLGIAGKKDDAKKIWSGLAARPDSPVAAEAKIRLGELEAAPAAKN